MEDIIEFKAIIEKEIGNYENFRIYAVTPIDKNTNIKYNKYGNVSISGDIQELTLGVEYTIKGKENKYGYEVLHILREKPQTKTQIKRFLKEVLTEKQAKILLEVYPNIIDKVINNDLDDIDLNKTKGIKEKTFEVVKRKIIENFHLMDFINEFKEYNISISLAKKLYDKFASVETMKEKMIKDPYETLCLINGISFTKADGLILSIEKNKKLKKSSQRIKACIKFCLNENEKEGNTWINLQELYNKCYKLVPESIELLIDGLKDNDIYFDSKRRIAWKHTYEKELYISRAIIFALKNNRKLMIDYSKYYRIGGSSLTKEQQGVLKNFCNSNISLLVGNAGSGKSFCTQAIINLCDDNDLSYILMTPTGKSAIVLSEYTNRDAGTIHRKLDYNPTYGWEYNKENKLDVDVIIVDENGMTDISLMKHLLEAIDFNKTRIAFVQDDAQLPSVSCGNCAYDLINSGIIPVTRLTQVFRYGEGGLLQVATKIRLGEKYLDDKNDDIQIFGERGDYSFIPTEDEYIKDYVVGIYQNLLKQGNSPIDIMVLCAKNINENGTIDLNNILQEKFNPYQEDIRYIRYGDNTFRKNDLVMQIKNNYKALNENYEEVTITNGEIGTIKQIDYNKIYVQYKRDMILYNKEDLDQLQLAYSISIHKSQGSGVKNVILVTPVSHKWTLNKNLMYVGATRAKEKCYHIALPETINYALRRSAELQRNTFLKDLLIELNTK
ncbi:exodeoxyribonuclease V subunit alpha [Clostridium sporogenes]|nr:exodeoxyribonuclease V subunit alpha [Clostridium sporogenes]